MHENSLFLMTGWWGGDVYIAEQLFQINET